MKMVIDTECFNSGADAAAEVYRYTFEKYKIVEIIKERSFLVESLKDTKDIKTLSYHRGFIWYLKRKIKIDSF